MQKPLVRFVEASPSRLYECHRYIISVTESRLGLIAALNAAKRSLDTPLLYAQLVTLANERQRELFALGKVVK